MSTLALNPIENSEDLIDSRNVIARIEWLENTEDEEEKEELAKLKDLQDQAEGYSEDWIHGATLIAESYFVEYAQELAEECCEMPDIAQWPLYCIDWEQAARELAMDYTAVDFDGAEYLIR